MASFDVTSTMDFAELNNAINQTQREVGNRYDFKGVVSDLAVDEKAAEVTLKVSDESKLDAFKDVFHTKLIKRGIPLMALDYQDTEKAGGHNVKQKVKLVSGISKEKGKEIIKTIKNAKLKVQVQMVDEQVRVTAKSRDILQEVIGLLKEKQDQLSVPMQYGNYRD